MRPAWLLAAKEQHIPVIESAKHRRNQCGDLHPPHQRFDMPVGCSPAAMGPMTFLVDAGKYDYHNCEQLAEQRKKAFQLATKSAGRRRPLYGRGMSEWDAWKAWGRVP